MSSNIKLFPNNSLSLQNDYSYANNKNLPFSETIDKLTRLNVLNFNSMYQPLIPIRSLSTRYQILGKLGSGSFGIVTLAKIKNDAMKAITNEMKSHKGTLLEPIPNHKPSKISVVAIKTMNIKLSIQDYSRVKEVKFILSLKSHPCLVQIYDIFIDRHSFKLHIVMESMDQNLYQLMKYRENSVFSPKTLKSILAQILAGIRHIHRNFYYHRDVKPENILVMQASHFYGSKNNIPNNKIHCPYIVKVADYGLARRIDNYRPYTAYVSTRWYRSPEILLRQNTYSFPIDIWAFGCVAIETAVFCPLFPGENELEQIWKILETLGGPEPSGYAYPPLGGYWDDAQVLAANLGFSLPNLPGTYIENLVPRLDMSITERNNFCKVVKQCLAWNPNTRIDIYSLCAMEYFDGTIIRQEDKQIMEEEKNLNFFNKSQEFAGLKAISDTLKSSTNNIKKPYHFFSQKEAQQEKFVPTPINNENQDPSPTNASNVSNTSRKIRKVPYIKMNMFNLMKRRNSNVVEKKQEEPNSSLVVNGDMSQLQENTFHSPAHFNTHINGDDLYPEALESDYDHDDQYTNYDFTNEEFDDEPVELYSGDYNKIPQVIPEPFNMLPFNNFQSNFKNADGSITMNDSDNQNNEDFAGNPNSCSITEAINYPVEDDYYDYKNGSNLYDWASVTNL